MIERPIYLEQLLHWKDHDVIKVVTGVRRCGKSTMLKMFRKELQKSGVPEENIISLNLEDIEGIDINDYRQLLQYFVDRLQPDGRMNYIFTQLSHHENEANPLKILASRRIKSSA